MSQYAMTDRSGDKVTTHSGQSAAQVMVPMFDSSIFWTKCRRMPDNLGLSRLFNALCNLFVFWCVFFLLMFPVAGGFVLCICSLCDMRFK